jgi:hypothetical protein
VGLRCDAVLHGIVLRCDSVLHGIVLRCDAVRHGIVLRCDAVLHGRSVRLLPSIMIHVHRRFRGTCCLIINCTRVYSNDRDTGLP